MRFLCFSAIALCRIIWVAMKSITVLGSDENCTDQAIALSDACTPHKGFHQKESLRSNRAIKMESVPSYYVTDLDCSEKVTDHD